MNARFILFFSVCTAAVAQQAQPITPPPVAPPAPAAQTNATAQVSTRTPEQLDQLLGPIALYPDALMALILPASTVPADIVLASRFLAAGGTADAIDSQPWDDSVKSLAHYPEVVKWMDDNLEWTSELGEVFVAQPADVMKAVQRLRVKAQATGALKSTPQQQVVMEGQDIAIVPAQPDVIYVPAYDPAVVYVATTYYPDPFLTFGVGFAVGPWLYYGCDWGQRVIWVGARGPRGNWRPPTLYSRAHYANNPDWRHWHPSYRARIGNRPGYYHPGQDVVRPRPYTGASPRPVWPRGIANPHDGGPSGRDNRPAGQSRAQWPRLTNQGAGSRLVPAPGTAAPQELNTNRPPGGRPTPTPAPDVTGPNGPNFGNPRHTRPEGGWNRGERGGNPTSAPHAGGTMVPHSNPAPAAGPRPVAGPPPVRQSAPFREQHSGPANSGPAHVNAPHAQPMPHVAPAAPRTPVQSATPATRPGEKDKNQN